MLGENDPGLIINNQHLSKMPANTIKGNNKSSKNIPLDLTVAQVTAMLNIGVPATATILNNTSGTITPTASGNWNAGSATVSLTNGTWLLIGISAFGSSGGSPAYSFVHTHSWCTADGANSGVQPALVQTSGNVTLKAGQADPALGLSNVDFFVNSGNGGFYMAPQIIVAVSATTSIFLVTNASMTTPANSRIKSNIVALKIATATS